MVRIANARGGEGFIAVTAEARKHFWLDRARTAAIAKHTNAFKINEDVVIPLRAPGRLLATASSASTSSCRSQNKLALLDALDEFFGASCRCTRRREADRRRAARRPRRAGARADRAARGAGSGWLDNLDRAAGEARTDVDRRSGSARSDAARPERVHALQDAPLRVSWKSEVREPLRALRRRASSQVIERIEAVHAEVLRGRVFVALHMHAGDGNVHTNIPVNSDDYEMLQEANAGGGAHHARWRTAWAA